MNRDDLQRMAQDSGLVYGYPFTWGNLEAFAALVAAATRKSMKAEGWRACAVGQRETQHCGLLETAVLAEREACARVCEEHAAEIHGYDKHGYADAIRARGEE